MAEEKKEMQSPNQEELINTSGKNRFLKIWGDPVFSKVIATGILFLMPIVSAFIIKFLEDKSIINLFTGFLELKIELYILLLIVIALTASYFIYLKYFQKRNQAKEMFMNQKIGHYRLGELNNILLTTYLDLPSQLIFQVGMKDMDLLTLFQIYIPMYNMGVDWNHPADDSGFIYYRLGPKLISYGLCHKVPSIKNQGGELDSYDIETSENGYQFFAMIERLARIENGGEFLKEHERREKIRQDYIESKKSAANKVLNVL